MELAINISGSQGSSQVDKEFQNWMAQSFPPNIHVPDDSEPNKMMDEELYRYAAEDRFDYLFRELHRFSSPAELSSIIYKKVGPSGNSLLHVAASRGSKKVTELLLQHFPLLLKRENFQKDTALHLAARAGQLGTTTILINKEKGNGGASNVAVFMETKNDRGNTALHDAVINHHHEVAHFLVNKHPKLSYMKNNERKSPLYLAVDNRNEKESDKKMLTILMDAIPDDVDLLKMLEGKSPVHAAVEGEKKDTLIQITSKKPELLRRKDEKGANALHCAASIGYVEGTHFLYDEYRDGAIEQNDDGNLPIHVASKKGHVEVVELYISKWTEPTEFLNRKGQNILHAAAESGQYPIVQYILENKKFAALANEKDKDGNTPLHLASKNGRSIAAYRLVCDKNVQKLIVNHENLTPYHVAEKQSKIVEAEYSGAPIPNGKESKVDQNDDKEKQESKGKLHHYTAESQVDQKDDKGKQESKGKLHYYTAMMTLSILHFYAGQPKKPKVEYFRVHGKPLPKEEIKSRIEALLVVAVLIASVTFAGVLQLPKSGINSESTNPNGFRNNKGITAENEAILRNVYIYFDLVALNAAVMASIILCWAQLYDVKVAAHAVWLASILTGGALYLMCLAFMFAVAIDVGENFAFFLVAILVGGGFFLVQTLVSAPLIIPPSANKIIENFLSPRIYFYMFISYLYFEWFLSKVSNRRKKNGKRQQSTPSSIK